jgi:hypothetical protein
VIRWLCPQFVFFLCRNVWRVHWCNMKLMRTPGSELGLAGVTGDMLCLWALQESDDHALPAPCTECPVGQSFVFSVCISPSSMRTAPWCSYCMMHQVIDNVFPFEDGTARAMEDGAAPPSVMPPDTARHGTTPLASRCPTPRD